MSPFQTSCLGTTTTLSHGFDVLAEQVTNELTEVEAPDGAVARSQGCLVGFHAALAKLATLFSMADQRLNARSAIDKSSVGLRGVFSQTADHPAQVAEGRIP